MTGRLFDKVAIVTGAGTGSWFGGRSGAVDPTITARHLAGERR